MKSNISNFVAKLIMVIAIIISMLFSSMVPIISFAVEEAKSEKENEYINFNLNWGNGQSEISVNNGTTTAYFNIQFDTISDFNNFRIEVEKTDLVAVIYKNSGEYFGDSSSASQIQYLKNIPGGTKISGTIDFAFSRTQDFSDYTKDLTIKLIGTYQKSGEEVEVEITKNLKANVTSTAIISAHSANIRLNRYNDKVYTSSNTNILYKVSKISERYSLDVDCYNSEYTNIELNLYRESNGVKYYPTNVEIEDNTAKGFEVTKVDNEDGTYKYTLVKGEEHSDYTQNTQFNIIQTIWLKVSYLIAEPEKDVRTTTNCNVKLISKGFSSKTDKSGTEYTKTEVLKDASTYYYYALYRYTPGAETWGNTYINTKSLVTYNQDKLKQFLQDGTMEVPFSTSFRYVEGANKEGNNTLTQDYTTIKLYEPDSNSYSFKTLNSNEMYVKKIEVSSIPERDDAWIKFYNADTKELFFTATSNNLTYEVPANTKIGSYYAETSNILINRYDGWSTIYEMSASAMQESGLTKEKILNIRDINKKQTSSENANMYTGKDIASYTIVGYEKQNISNFAIASNVTMDSNISQVSQVVSGSIELSLGASGIINTDDIKNLNIVNTNPVFYIKLPNDFDFDITNVSYRSNPINIIVDTWKIKKVNGYKILQITSKGTIDASKNSEEESLIINYKRKLKQGTTSTWGVVDVYMKTDEEKYYSSVVDLEDYDEDGNISDELAYSRLYYRIGYNAQIQLSNSAYTALGEIKSNEDVIIQAGDTVKYRVVLDNLYEDIKNINVVSRLPFEGNKTILGDNLIDLGSTTTFSGIKDIKVYTKTSNSSDIELDPSNYTIGYSQDEVANFENEYTESEENAKTLMLKLSEDYILKRGSQLIIEYSCDVPEDAQEGKTSVITSAVKYKNISNVPNSQEAVGMKVKVGDNTGTIDVIKSFELAPNTPSLEGIEFKIVNMNDNSISYTKRTDSNGKATFTNVPVGEWEIIEITEFENFKPESSKYVKISNGEKYTKESENAINFVNKMKKSKIKIVKEWEDTNDIQESNIEFALGLKNGEYFMQLIGGIRAYDIEDKNGNKTSVAELYVPYGSYSIRETKGKDGWYAEDVNVEATSEEVTTTVVNKVTKGDLKIIKTVPKGDLAEGLSFKITGTGDISYTNKQGNEVIFNIDKTIVANNEETNATVEFSDDKRIVNITVKDLPMGTYKIEEVNMPKINTDTEEVTKYVEIKKSFTIPNENGKLTTINLENRHRQGSLNIHVTANEGVELDKFKVKVSGTTYYNKQFEEEYNVPSSGNLKIEGLDIGKYKVEEVDTKQIDGKIVTTNPDGFEVTYSPNTVNTTGIEVQHNKTSDVSINNQYYGKGIVKIQKSLEAEEDVTKASGINFKITGKDLIGNDVDETIVIGKDGIGVSNEIPVGTYLLSEVEETVPQEYDVMEEQEIVITTENTSQNPLLLPIENKLASGKIIMETETEQGEYPYTPVTYSVTKVDNKLQKVEKSIEVRGDKNSYAELNNLKAGKYVVEQKKIPDGYIKDTRQIVNITRSESGYALFIISKEKVEEFENTKVTINKEILNEQGTTATKEDFEKAKIDAKDKYSFEVKIQNIDTKETYYSFIDEKNTDTIVGLPYGTYEIEEIYKPKFKMLEIQAAGLQKDEETGKYLFTLSDEEEKDKITILIKNQIDTSFGFGGQDFKDNLSKVIQETVEETVVTKSKIYVRDDDNNRISDATFKLYDLEGNVIKFAGSSGTYLPSEEGNEVIKPTDGTIILKALPVGDYKLVNETVGSNFLKSSDKIVTVYSNAVGITRIELLKNIPRGSLRLSTTYNTESGEQKYVPNSKYKILDTETNEVLTFVKKADGTYQRANLPNATEKISLRAGYVDVNGIEAKSSYKIAPVDLTEKYGVIDEDPLDLNIKEGEVQQINVEVEDRSGPFVKVITPDAGWLMVALDKNGKIWACDTDSNKKFLEGHLKDKDSSKLECISDNIDVIKDVVFKDIFCTTYDGLFIAIDEQGKVWAWGKNKYNLLGKDTNIPICISNIEGNPLHDNNLKIEKVIEEGHDRIYFLDSLGKVWYCGEGEYRMYYYDDNSNSYSNLEPTKLEPTNGLIKSFSDLFDLRDVVITDIEGGQNHVIAVDSNGKVWTWGLNYRGSCGIEIDNLMMAPTCISNIQGSNIKNIKIKKVEAGYDTSYLIDTQNHIWAFGLSNYGMLGNGPVNSDDYNNPGYWNPICLNSNNPDNPLNGIGIVDINCAYYTVSAIDEFGRLWTWGKEYDNGILGTGYRYTYDGSGSYNKGYAYYPMCISELDNNELDKTKLVSVSYLYLNVAAAIDEDGCIWVWGDVLDYFPFGMPSAYPGVVPPRKLTKSTKSYFAIPNFVKVEAGTNHSAAIDEEGRVWTWGYNGTSDSIILGNEDAGEYSSIPVCVGGYNNKISNEKIVDIAVGYNYTLALDSKGNVWIWGQNCDRLSGMD